MRELGYHFFREEKEKSELTFIRSIGQGSYPRFHIYLKFDEKRAMASYNLHLDQKKPVYKGVTAHSAEYDGRIVEQETERIKTRFEGL